MGFTRFHRRIQIIPGVHLNIGKTGISVSAGIPGAEVTLGPKSGLRATVGVPGTGLSYTQVVQPKPELQPQAPKPQQPVEQPENVIEWYVWDGTETTGPFDLLSIGLRIQAGELS